MLNLQALEAEGFARRCVFHFSRQDGERQPDLSASSVSVPPRAGPESSALFGKWLSRKQSSTVTVDENGSFTLQIRGLGKSSEVRQKNSERYPQVWYSVCLQSKMYLFFNHLQKLPNLFNCSGDPHREIIPNNPTTVTVKWTYDVMLISIFFFFFFLKQSSIKQNTNISSVFLAKNKSCILENMNHIYCVLSGGQLLQNDFEGCPQAWTTPVWAPALPAPPHGSGCPHLQPDGGGILRVHSSGAQRGSRQAGQPNIRVGKAPETCWGF